VVYSCKYHVVGCPKYRRSVLNDIVQKELKAIIEEVCGQRKREILAVELMPDHVHFRSRLPTLWTNSYFMSTVGGAPLSVIKQYVENQKAV